MRLYFFVKLKCHTSAIPAISLGIKCDMRDLIKCVNYSARAPELKNVLELSSIMSAVTLVSFALKSCKFHS